MRHQIEPRSQSLPSFKEGVGNKFLTPSISHRLLVPITAIIKSERAQYFLFRNRFVLCIVVVRIKTPEERSFGYFYSNYNSCTGVSLESHFLSILKRTLGIIILSVRNSNQLHSLLLLL